MNFKDSKKHHWKTALFCSHPLYLGQMGWEEFPKHCCYVASFLLIIFFSFIIVFIVEYSAYYFPSSPIKRQDINNKDLSHSEQGLFFKNVQGLVYIADGWKSNSMRIYLWVRIWLSYANSFLCKETFHITSPSWKQIAQILLDTWNKTGIQRFLRFLNVSFAFLLLPLPMTLF